MDDIRSNKQKSRLRRSILISKILNYIILNRVKITVTILVLFLMFFPAIFGSIVGDWFNTLVSSFIGKLNF